jgi:PBP1b-binding outer membrane lipoprotein LpoB
MKKIIFLMLLSICFLTGCSTTYKIDQQTYNEMTEFLNSCGNEYVNYVRNDESLSKRDKNTKETKYIYYRDLIIEIGNEK